MLGAPLPLPRQMSLRNLHTPGSQALLDSALVVTFPGPLTATGEDIVELHLHGGSAVVSDVLDVLTAQPQVRLAEAGEFTRRAFANNRIDLAQVEGLADLIAAETSSQRVQALALAGGALENLAEHWRNRILDVLVQAEAGLDFGEDEADVSERLMEASTRQLVEIAMELEALLADAGRATRIRNGLTIVVAGSPNVGKSSLVNALAMQSAAIVTAIAGTTRDLVEVPIALDGVAAVLIDTAGLRETSDPIEAEGIRRARARAANADLVLQVSDVGDFSAYSGAGERWTIRNKADLAAVTPTKSDHTVSALTGLGISELRRALGKWAATTVRPGEPALLANARHKAAFVDAANAVCSAAQTNETVLRAEELRRAVHALGLVAGRVAVDEVLDRIFSQFCIGK